MRPNWPKLASLYQKTSALKIEGTFSDITAQIFSVNM